MEMNDQVLIVVQSSQGAFHEEIEFLHSQNVSLARELDDCMSSPLEAILE